MHILEYIKLIFEILAYILGFIYFIFHVVNKIYKYYIDIMKKKDIIYPEVIEIIEEKPAEPNIFRKVKPIKGVHASDLIRYEQAKKKIDFEMIEKKNLKKKYEAEDKLELKYNKYRAKILKKIFKANNDGVLSTDGIKIKKKEFPKIIRHEFRDEYGLYMEKIKECMHNTYYIVKSVKEDITKN